MSSDQFETMLPRVSVNVEKHSDGSLVVSSATPLEAYPECLVDKLIEWAQRTPNQVFLAKRPAPGAPWVTVTYAQAMDAAHRIATAISGLGLSAERPIAVLSENDLDHALLGLGAALAGVPFAPVSAAYSLQSQDFGKLRHVLELITPGLVFASDGARYGRAIEAVVPADCQVVLKTGSLTSRNALQWDAWSSVQPKESVATLRSRINADQIVKFLFTSGSTKLPKAVINTNRMICCNQSMIAQSLPFLRDKPPVFLDWLPWSHTFGGNHNFYMALFNGGTLYIDDGKPVPTAIGQTIANLREISPTAYFNVPKGYDMLTQAMKTDASLCGGFFKDLKLIFFSGASLPAPVWELLYSFSEQTVGRRVPIITSLGMTESSPAMLIVNRAGIQPGEVGVPMPGTQIKLIPSGDKLEARYRGPNITPGYWRMPEESAAAFDTQGWFCTGDALRFVDERNPDMGLAFNGRTGEDFKLITGTWVSTSSLRAKAGRLGSPYLVDIVVVGHDRGEVAAIAVPNLELCKTLVGDPNVAASSDPKVILRDARVQQWLQSIADAMAQGVTGSADRIVRWAFVEAPLSLDRGELTDKGSINQRMVMTNHAQLVKALYGEAQTDQPIVTVTC